ncbi:MAG: hypothetical protein HUU15_16095 [Candidatus Brocadiae bacterium]|nr:hypothetical protein [Candidatus Brocadiia bacterium]
MHTAPPPIPDRAPMVLAGRARRAARWILAVGAAGIAAGLLLDAVASRVAGDSALAGALRPLATDRAWPNLLLAAYYLLGLGLAGGIFLATQYITQAGWSVAVRRVAEAMTALLPLAALGMIFIALGAHRVYEWSHTDVVAADPLLQKKSAWLNSGFFLARTVVYVVIWTLLIRALVASSRRQDADGQIRWTLKNVRLSAFFLVVFAVTFTAASFDWIMSLDPHWFSTVFAVYHFAGLFLSGLAALTFLVILMRRAGPLAGIASDDHLHDLGKLVFGFSTFWAYIWYSQYMLIWYTNIPEETSYYLLRHTGAWGPLAVANLCLNWVIPFLVLLPRAAKRSEKVLLVVAGVLLVGRWLDLYLMILPPFAHGSPVFGIWEGCTLLVVPTAFLLVVLAAFSRARAVPARDPFLEESLNHHI